MGSHMLHINEAQAKGAISVRSALPILRQAYLECNEGHISVGPRIVMHVNDSGGQGQWLTGKYPRKGLFGSKFSSSFGANSEKDLPSTISTISLYSDTTGELEGLVCANALTSIKTAGSAAIATELLSRKNSSNLAIIGSGVQALDQVLAISEVRDIRRVIIYNRTTSQAKKFIGYLEAVEGFTAETKIAHSAEEAVSEADIVCTCTTSHQPVFKSSALKPGTHINAIGSYTPYMQEIDSETVVRADSVFTEHVDGLWAAAGDILKPLQEGLIDKSKVKGSLGELLSGTVTGRISEDQITLYESVGSAALDLALAVEVYLSYSRDVNSNKS